MAITRRQLEWPVEGTGNGGFAGVMAYHSMARGLEAGYAVSGTDTGHSGTMVDARWALGHPQKIEDFAWRAIHETAITSKAIIRAYYGKSAAYSYFCGCSTGGRKGMIEAQRCQKDYNGIIVGDPAMDWGRALAADAWDLQLASKPGNWISPATLAAVHKATLSACHAVNGVIADPPECHVNLSKLLCKPGQSRTCLTPAQLAVVRDMYAGPKDAAGRSIYPGYEPDTESSWSLWVMGPREHPGLGLKFPFPRGFFGRIILQNPHWDLHKVSLNRLLALARSRTVHEFYAENPDLHGFELSGGKLIQYHGWNDVAVPPDVSIRYYDSVAARMGGVRKFPSFYRLFMGPGMEHCGGGPGPNAIGGAWGAPAPVHDDQHDVLAALAHWAEDGRAPRRLIATLYRHNSRHLKIIAQRPWCPYRAVARYSGHGVRTVAANYRCERPR